MRFALFSRECSSVILCSGIINYGIVSNKLGIIIIICIVIFSACQSRTISRWTGEALQLELPDDFDRPISFASGRKGEKDLFYWSTDGQMKVKTFTDWGLLESEIVFVKK